MPFQGYANREELMTAILDRASTDRRFREDLLQKPRGTIYQDFGVQIPASYRVRFVERDPNLDALVVLPDFCPSDGELSDDDLELVAGGTGGAGGTGDDNW